MKKYVIASILLCLLMMTPPIYIASAASTTLAVNPLNSYVTIGHTVNVDINVTDVANLTSWQFTLYFLNAVLNCTGITEGPFLQTGGGTFFGKTITNNFNITHGKLVAYSTLLGTTKVDGSGVLATITFNTLSVGDSPLHLSDTKLGDEKIPPQPIPHTIIDGSVHVQNFTLTVSTVGSGTVALNNTGPYYHYGEAVQLTANPATGWSFDHWSGDLTGPSNPATLIITGNMSATATFTQNQYTLTVTIVGHGSVGKSPDQATYTWGTNVTLTANADIGWTFASWSGDASGTASPTTVNMTGNKAVTATFTQNVYTLTVTVSPVGSGSVALNNTGPDYHYGDHVQLNADPNTGWTFDHWSGDLIGSANPAALTITGNMAVTATFVQINYTLTVSTVGSGTVALNNTGPNYHYGDVVRLTANPTIGWSFDHWSGGLSGSSNPATLIITGNMAVTATFVQINYTLTVSTSGSGSVNLNNTGPNYHYGDAVKLTAVPATGWSFDHWSGDLTGSSNPATLTITGNMTVTATFVQINYTLTVSVVGSGTVPLNNTGPYYHYGDAVKLTATPDTDWSFQYWSGDLSGSASPATLVMTANFSVTAHFLQTPTLQMSPTSKTCRIYNENFTVTITISNAANVEDFKFLIRYNTTLLNYVSVTWNAWGPGTITVDEAGGIITVSNSGTSISGTQTLITINFTTSFNHIWKVAPGWTNDLTDIIFFQWANISYPSGPDLRYERGGSSQINVGPDFAYTFSPIQGDADNNGIIELFDLRTVAFYFGFNQGDSGWDDASKYDLNGDGTIDVYDLRIIAVNFGYTYNP